MIGARILWLLLGLVSTGCGLAGAVLPLVPTTPFLLVAAFAFARSSPRLHGWLVRHPRFGPLILNWQHHGAISPGAKRAALLFMGAALGLSVLLGVPGWVLAIQAVVMGCVAIFLLTRPNAGPTNQGF